MQAETIAALTTAAGTLVLAVATFAATRSANRSSRLAEAALLAGLRPVLVPIARRERFAVDLLYGDLQGGQRAITRFTFMPAGEDRWISSMSRHWQLDGPNVR